jgi:tRNA A-37 threonylcarbamoyl transferase component Bud32
MVEGTQVGGYKVLHRIGEGGMGSVWLAEHAMLGRRAAIKMLHPEFSNRREIVTRFFNEARAATAIADPGIVQIFDFGHHVDGSAYIVMELLDGEPLDKRVARLGTLGVPDALRIMRQVASTLGAAHARGIVHRDLKPENIYLVRDPEVASGERAKVLDFGIAKLATDQGGVKTHTQAVMGTPAYMSPEQCRGAGHVDQRSDVYALGCVLFRLLCGKPPFDAEGIGEIIVMHMREPPAVPSSLRPGIPAEVDQLVLRCLAKDPAQRFSSGAELAIAIGALTGSSPHVPAASGHYAAASAPTTLSSATGVSAQATGPGAPSTNRSRPLLLAGIGIASVGAAFAIVYVATRGSTDGAATTSSETETEPAQAPAASGLAHAAPAEAALTRAAPAETKPKAAPDPRAETIAHMKAVVVKLLAWSTTNQGAPCPDVAALGITREDAWGNTLRITCTDQPADQIAGVVSTGPDGVIGTSDDIASWTLGASVTDPLRGPRWTVAAAAPKPRTTTRKASDKPAKATATKPTKAAGGMELDENGLPISR